MVRNGSFRECSPDGSPGGVHALVGPVARMGRRVHRGDEVVGVGDGQEKQGEDRDQVGHDGDCLGDVLEDRGPRHVSGDGGGGASVLPGRRAEEGVEDAARDRSRGGVDERRDGESRPERRRISERLEFLLKRPLLTRQMPGKALEAPGEKHEREEKGQDPGDDRQVEEKVRERRAPSENDRLRQENEAPQDRRKDASSEDPAVPVPDDFGRPYQVPSGLKD